MVIHSETAKREHSENEDDKRLNSSDREKDHKRLKSDKDDARDSHRSDRRRNRSPNESRYHRRDRSQDRDHRRDRSSKVRRSRSPGDKRKRSPNNNRNKSPNENRNKLSDKNKGNRSNSSNDNRSKRTDESTDQDQENQDRKRNYSSSENKERSRNEALDEDPDKKNKDSPSRNKQHKSPPRRRRSRSQDRRRRSPRSPKSSYSRNHRSRDSSQDPPQSRYWDMKKGDDAKEKSQYWNKYPRDENVGKRYYGENTTDNKKDDQNEPEAEKKTKKKNMDLLTTRTGGAYIPPARLRMMQEEITDKSSIAYQRISWEALKKSIHGFINKVNTGNIAIITREMFKENIIRARGLLCRSLMQAQAASPTFTNVYAALVSVINCKFPSIGELLLKRLIKQFKNSFRRNNKPNCISSVTFIAHLVNQKVAHEIIGLEILSLLIESSTNDSIEVAIEFLKQSGQKLTEVSNLYQIILYDLKLKFLDN